MPQTREHKSEDLPQSDLKLLAASDVSVADEHPIEAVLPVPDTHPLAHLAGKYNEEPLWDDFLQAMHEVRCRMNAQ